MYKIIGADQVEYGPVTAAQLNQWISEGRANAASLAWPEGAAEWKPLGSLPEFAAILGARVAAPQIIGPTAGYPRRTNNLAVAGMIMGVLSVLLGWCFFTLVFCVLGLVFSIAALSQIKRNPETESGRGMAVAGIILSVIGFFECFGFVLLFGLLRAAANGLN